MTRPFPCQVAWVFSFQTSSERVHTIPVKLQMLQCCSGLPGRVPRWPDAQGPALIYIFFLNHMHAHYKYNNNIIYIYICIVFKNTNVCMHIDRCIVYASIVYLCHGMKCTMWPTAAQAPKYHQPQPHWLSSSSSVCLHIQLLLLPSATTCNDGEPELEWVATDWHVEFQMNACHTPHHWSVTGPSFIQCWPPRCRSAFLSTMRFLTWTFGLKPVTM